MLQLISFMLPCVQKCFVTKLSFSQKALEIAVNVCISQVHKQQATVEMEGFKELVHV